jgi:hypothetical protein
LAINVFCDKRDATLKAEVKLVKGEDDLMKHFNLAVPRNWLLALAGLMWTGVGLMLCRYAFTWVTQPLSLIAVSLGLAGLTISVAANRWQFSGLALKNIARIQVLPERACVFSFLAPQGYLIIALMMTVGILLRNSAIPRPYLAVVYAAIGGALLQGSAHYYRHLFAIGSARGE